MKGHPRIVSRSVKLFGRFHALRGGQLDSDNQAAAIKCLLFTTEYIRRIHGASDKAG